VNKLEHSAAHPAKTSPRALTLTEFLAKEYPPEPPTPWGRFTTSDGTKYLFNRGYVCFVVKRPGQQPEPCEAIWPPDVVERLIFGDARDRSGRPVKDPWTEEMGQYEHYQRDGRCMGVRWRKRASRSRGKRATA
jgi:hypothetical protein